MGDRLTRVEEAVKAIGDRKVFPTELKSWALEQLPVEWKQ